MMAKSEYAFRRAALLRSKTALLFCHIRIAMIIIAALAPRRKSA